MPTNFMTRLAELTSLSEALDRLEAATLEDRITHPNDGLLQLEADRTIRDISKMRMRVHKGLVQLYAIAKLN